MPKRTSHPRNGPSQRQLRVGELIRHSLAESLTRGEIHDEVINDHVITISEVRMTPDLRLATIFVMPLGGVDVQPVLDALQRNRRFIRGLVARAVNLKFAPEIRFREDESYEGGSRIDRLLDSLKPRTDGKDR
jgi:ribosome-binding factor A